MYHSLYSLRKIKETSFDGEAKIAFFSAKSYMVELTIGITSNIQSPNFFLFDTG